jgi:hypothetical protein
MLSITPTDPASFYSAESGPASSGYGSGAGIILAYFGYGSKNGWLRAQK